MKPEKPLKPPQQEHCRRGRCSTLTQRCSGRPTQILCLCSQNKVVLFDNDNDEGLLAVQEDAAEAMAGAVYDGPLACVRVRSISLPWRVAHCVMYASLTPACAVL